MQTKRRYNRRLLKDGELTVYTHRRLGRAGQFIYKTYECLVVVIEGLPCLRAEKGSVWFQPVYNNTKKFYEHKRVVRADEMEFLENAFQERLTEQRREQRRMRRKMAVK